jgi:CRP-like cAMP-binding protein
MSLNDEDIPFAKEAIVKTGLFSGITEAELNSLADGMEKQSYHANAAILFQGEISNRLYLVQQGLVSVWARKNNEKIKVAELGAGCYFGEISLLTPCAATATIKAEKPTDIISLPGEVVEAMVKRNPVLSTTIHKEIEKRLAERKHALEKDR